MEDAKMLALGGWGFALFLLAWAFFRDVLLGGQKLAPASTVAERFKIVFKWMGIFVVGIFILSFIYNIFAEPTLLASENLAISFFRGIAASAGVFFVFNSVLADYH